ncbi:polysaccharide export protein [Limisphaera ngatamarikiensis]|uniref:Polysaccharide export protein n=1 Tax=Limisphaera ngatamarikiensis TaxID=1324935 RepID=A0A6M1RN82_9BACT|nr:polysaccharide biosynthesis/export family protein [Limisphaera ngatamarikiensis]NGO39019.1 polysaccharide export protein [Limisphaera ngatamarikiensis]
MKTSIIPTVCRHLRELPRARIERIAALLSLLLGACWLFIGCETPPPSPVTPGSAPIAAPYTSTILSEGDTIRVAFEADTNLNTVAKIQLDGTVTLPLIGAVPAAGKTPEELRTDLMKRYEKLLSINELTVSVLSATASVYVSGAVLKPGRIPMDRPMTALEAIMEAGGFDLRRAKLKEVTVIRKQDGRQEHYTLNLQDALRGRDPNPFYLKPFDIIHVPEKRFNF